MKSTEEQPIQRIQSALYTGSIRHRRFVPIKNDFKYPIFMFYLDLDELDKLFDGLWYASVERLNLVNFKRSDYFKPDVPCLKTAVIDASNQSLSEQGVDHAPITKVRMLSHLRLFNITFNPVSFYYGYDDDDQLVSILAEITNTPWDQRHHYVLPVGRSTKDYQYQLKGENKHAFDFDKAFHVSPFNPMNMTYHWVFNEPDQRLHVHMDNLLMASASAEQASDKHFDATLTLDRKEISTDLSKALIRQPWMTVKVVTGIYWQAFKLWVRKAPFYDHPDASETSKS